MRWIAVVRMIAIGMGIAAKTLKKNAQILFFGNK